MGAGLLDRLPSFDKNCRFERDELNQGMLEAMQSKRRMRVNPEFCQHDDASSCYLFGILICPRHNHLNDNDDLRTTKGVAATREIEVLQVRARGKPGENPHHLRENFFPNGERLKAPERDGAAERTSLGTARY